MPGRYLDVASPLNRDHPLSYGLASWWLPLPGRLGYTLYDVAGRFNAALTNFGAAVPYSRAFNGLPALAFDGTDDYAEASLSVTTARPATWSGAFRAVTRAGNLQSIMTRADSTSNNGVNVYLDSSGNLAAEVKGASGSQGGVSLAGCGDGRWHFFSWTFGAAGAPLSLYVDGALAGTNTAGTWAMNANPVRIGRAVNVTFFQAMLGTVQTAIIHGRALSGPECVALYDQFARGFPDALRWLQPRDWSFGTAGGGYPWWAGARGGILGSGVM